VQQNAKAKNNNMNNVKTKNNYNAKAKNGTKASNSNIKGSTTMI
jgi:hypothetical protein